MRVRAARGAITVERDEARVVLDATARLLQEMIATNAVEADEVVSIFFTMTGDLSSAFPAEAAREAGLTQTALLCAREIDVPGAVPRVIRILLHYNTETAAADVRDVYLEGARALRPDRG
ncbi:MAG: chorismate mutase [Actinobacteria bacterium]|nr:chorismate mutase [Actinomycetota bacterium]